MSHLLQDIKFGLRLLWKQKGFALTTILTLAACIGANATIFSIVNAVLLRPLPFPEADRLVTVNNSYPGAGVERASNGVPDYFDRKRDVEAFEEIALYRDRGMTIGQEGRPERVTGFELTPSLFRILKAQPYRGRLLNESDGVEGQARQIVISFEEYQASGTVIRGLRPPSAVMAAGPWRESMQQIRLRRAEENYRAALKRDPELLEARVRLGRVLRQRGMLPEARTELETAVQTPDAPPVFLYLAELFLTDVLDAQGDNAAALARARDLVERYPECQSSHLALGRAYEAKGDRAAAVKALEPLWKEAAARQCEDPWWSYYLGQVWRIRARFESLRARVRDAR